MVLSPPSVTEYLRYQFYSFILFLFLGPQIKIHCIFEIQQLTTNNDFGNFLKDIIRVMFVCYYLTFNLKQCKLWW